MIFLLLSILCSASILIIFKYLSLKHIPVFPVIVINYTICVLCGAIQIPFSAPSDALFTPWTTMAFAMGTLFISVFYLMSLSVTYSGVTITSVANKLSLIIPVIAAMYLYGDSNNFFKTAGIILAILSILLVVSHEEKTGKRELSFLHYILPVLVLAGSGMVDTLANYSEKTLVPASQYNYFLVFVFGTAAIIGWAVLVPLITLKKQKLSKKIILGGIGLGIPNYFSMYFLIMGLHSSGLESSVFFPVNNISIVILSFICAVALFKEKYSNKNLAGIALAIISIVLMIWA